MKSFGKRIAYGLTRRVNTRLHRLAKRMPPGPLWDRLYHETLFFRCHGRYPRKPWLFHDYLHQMKIDGTLADPLRVFVTDKELSKMFVTGTVGEEYAVPTIAVLRNEQEIDAFEFPDTCFIKATNGCNENIFKKPEDEVNRSQLKSWLSLDYYEYRREPNYKGLQPKIIVEPVIFSGEEFSEYSIFCWNGEPKMVASNIMDYKLVKKIKYRVFFDINKKILPFKLGYPSPPPEMHTEPPENFEEMLLVSERISRYFSLIRVDIYSTGDKLYVGEITNCHAGATQNFLPQENEEMASELLFQST